MKLYCSLFTLLILFSGCSSRKTELFIRIAEAKKSPLIMPISLYDIQNKQEIALPISLSSIKCHGRPEEFLGLRGIIVECYFKEVSVNEIAICNLNKKDSDTNQISFQTFEGGLSITVSCTTE